MSVNEQFERLSAILIPWSYRADGGALHSSFCLGSRRLGRVVRKSGGGVGRAAASLRNRRDYRGDRWFLQRVEPFRRFARSAAVLRAILTRLVRLEAAIGIALSECVSFLDALACKPIPLLRLTPAAP